MPLGILRSFSNWVVSLPISRLFLINANTGFYYVRYSDKTRHFFDELVKRGDLVLHTKSHQAALTTLVNEHATLRGLRVKVMKEDQELFLSGYHYHARKDLMGKLRKGRLDPYLFHANWCTGDEKRPMLQKFKNWYAQDQCQ